VGRVAELGSLGALVRIVKYYVTAFAMGALWFLALYPFAGGLPLGGELFPFDLIAMCLASLTVAATFRRKITQASRRAFVLLSVLLPCVGAFIFGAFFVAFMAVQNVIHDGLLPDAEALMIPVVCVIYGAIGLCFVSVPMGLLSQYVMQKVSRPCA